MNDTILITGGAGYIGSHMVWHLRDRGLPVLVLDNLLSGHRELIKDTELVQGNVGDSVLLNQLFSRRSFRAIMHFASFIEVGESVQNPQKYRDNNVAQTRVLIDAAKNHNVPSFIFSSSAAVYGAPRHTPISEDHPLLPINPYGENKQEVEVMLKESGMRHGILRYFNAAGADPNGRTGEWHEPESHLIPRVLQALENNSPFTLYGNDYPTPDGTCIRDYVHVSDICDAHLKLLEYLESDGKESIFNIGTGTGYSVYEVLETASEVVGKALKSTIQPRRPGDPARLVADGCKAQKLLGWKPEHNALSSIISHAWAWERKRKTLR